MKVSRVSGYRKNEITPEFAGRFLSFFYPTVADIAEWFFDHVNLPVDCSIYQGLAREQLS